MAPVLIYFLMTIFYLSTVSAQTYSFRQNATGPSSVCEGSNVTLQCVIVLISADNITIVQPTVWTRNGMPVQVTNSNGTSLIPNHNLMFNPTTGGLTDLVITNFTLDDNNTLYICTATGATITSSVVLNVTGLKGVPSNPPNITLVSPLSNSSFTVNWTISDPNYNYTVIWTNLNTSVMNSSTVPENTNSYTVTGLSDTDNYNVSVAAVNMCGNKTSDPMTVTAPVSKITTTVSPTPSPSNTPGSRNLEDDNSNGNTIVIIVVLIVVITVVAAVVVTVIGSILCWRHFHKEGFIKPNENGENNYAQPIGNSPQSQQKPNEDYAYAVNGPRGVVFPSSSLKPQQQ